ncbi:hypothetical protein [Cryptosporangium aurantiacum]|uniref:Uncharacterized protein n=1 Tax=Cryptosporangium aurantiacum TaxID=134849 RepID=A0A1M7RN50_9ACTN|nr:hypothetical protein [Cryptosporangium aurantiacum]SHN47620.1 hypothetical protein SAMN05443668_1262 [Cryptosporangium aurantiacum]
MPSSPILNPHNPRKVFRVGKTDVVSFVREVPERLAAIGSTR